MEEREALAQPRKPSKLILDEKDVPEHMRANNPPPKETCPVGTRSVNENAASFKEILDRAAAAKAEEAIAEARDPKHLQVFRRLQEERDKMKVKSDGTTNKEAS